MIRSYRRFTATPFRRGTGTSYVILTGLFYIVLAAACGDDGEGAAGTPPAAFEEFAWQSNEPDVRTERLCTEAADPDHAADTTFIHCRVEGATFARDLTPPRDPLVVMAYNIERGFQIDRQLDVILHDSRVPVPDILLLAEADRGCRRTNFRNIARDYAQALGFYYVFATEFVELPSGRGFTGPYDPPLCEHGNAIVSRYPLGNVRALRHRRNWSWYTPPGFAHPDEPRLGGRIAIAADVRVGKRLVRVYSLHLESTAEAMGIRDAQAREIADDGLNATHPVIAAGDLNAYLARFDLESGTRIDGTTQAFLTRGYTDAHAGLPPAARVTSLDQFATIIDFIFVRGVSVVDAGICPVEICKGLSDHLPIWAEIQ